MKLFRLFAQIVPLIAIVALHGCRSARPNPNFPDLTAMNLSPDPALARLNPQFVVEKIEEKKYFLGFNAGAGGDGNSPDMIALRGIKLAVFRIYTPRGLPVDSGYVDEITSSGTMNSETGRASIMTSAGLTWEAIPLLSEGTYAVMTLYGRNGTYQARAVLPVSSEPVNRQPKSPKSVMKPSVILAVEVEKLGKLAQFIITAKRVTPAPEGEYLPSSEDVRVELENDAGETVWSSSYDKMFAAVIGQVQPQDVGKQFEYRIQWDGYGSLTHAPLPPGTYRLIATIPAKPAPYTIREDLVWGGVK